MDIRRTTVFVDAHEVVHHQLVGLLKARGAQICPAVFFPHLDRRGEPQQQSSDKPVSVSGVTTAASVSS